MNASSLQAPGDRNHPENPVLLSLQGTFPPAILALADGTGFIGNSIGAAGTPVGEVVVNTSMTRPLAGSNKVAAGCIFVEASVSTQQWS